MSPRSVCASESSIERVETVTGRCRASFSEMDWKHARALTRIREVEQAERDRKEKQRIQILPVEDVLRCTNPRTMQWNRQPLSVLEVAKLCKPRGFKENAIVTVCPVIKSNGVQCKCYVKPGHFICGKHRLPTNEPYVPKAK